MSKQGNPSAGHLEPPGKSNTEEPLESEGPAASVRERELQNQIKVLIGQLSHAEEDKRIAAINTLAEIGYPAVRPLTKALRSTNSITRGNAASTLGQMASTFGYFLACEYGLLAEQLPITSRALIKTLLDKVTQNRYIAAWALGEIKDATSVPELLKVLRGNPDADVRTSAAWALGEINAASFSGEIKDTTAVPRLLEALKADQNAQVRAKSAVALSKINDVSAVPGLLEALRNDSESDVRAAAAMALGGIEARRPIEEVSAVLGLLEALRVDPEPEVRRDAAEAVGMIAPSAAEVRTALLARLADEDAEVRRQVTAALGNIRAAADEHADEAEAERRAAREQMLPALRQLRDRDPSELVRIQAEVQLVGLQNKEEAGTPVLVDASAAGWPTLSPTALFENTPKIYMVYLIRLIFRQDGKEGVVLPSRYLAEELVRRFKLKGQTDKTVRNHIEDVEKMFRKHFGNTKSKKANREFKLFESIRSRGLSIATARNFWNEDIDTAWEMIKQVGGMMDRLIGRSGKVDNW